MYPKSNKGFTLIELMIVVVIIGILTAIAIPKFMSASSKTKQSEAKLILKQIYVNQRAYFQENGEYWDPGGTILTTANPNAFRTILAELMAEARYQYEISITGANFTATATCLAPGLDDDPAPDVWTIDQDGELLNPTNDIFAE